MLGSKLSKKSGFTLVELIVVISIVMAILGVIVLDQADYNDKAVLINTAEELAATIHQAQVYGSGVQALPGSADFKKGYGVSVDITEPARAKGYNLFSDTDENKLYNDLYTCPGGSECVNRTSLTNGIKIDSICKIKKGQADVCNLTRADITFLRPSLNATLRLFNGAALDNENNVIGTRIRLVSENGYNSSVTVYISGQVSVE